MSVIRKLAMAAAASVANLFAAAPAFAADAVVQPSTDPCSTEYVSGAIACQGYYGKNLLSGTFGSTAEIQTIISTLLSGNPVPTDTTAAYTGGYTLDTSTVLARLNPLNGAQVIDFGTFHMSGLTVFGIHFGNNSDPGAAGENNFTGFWLVDLGAATTSQISLASPGGTSNAQIFATGNTPAVPEPSTWAMMLLGFGAVGVAMRRRRPSHSALLQVA